MFLKNVATPECLASLASHYSQKRRRSLPPLKKVIKHDNLFFKTTKLILLDSLLQEAEHVARLSVSDSWGSQL